MKSEVCLSEQYCHILYSQKEEKVMDSEGDDKYNF